MAQLTKRGNIRFNLFRFQDAKTIKWTRFTFPRESESKLELSDSSLEVSQFPFQ